MHETQSCKVHEAKLVELKGDKEKSIIMLLVNTATWMYLKSVKWKKPDLKRYMLRDSIYMAFWKKQNCQVSGYQGIEARQFVGIFGVIITLVLHPDCGKGHMTMHLSKPTKLCTKIKECILPLLNYK